MNAYARHSATTRLRPGLSALLACVAFAASPQGFAAGDAGRATGTVVGAGEILTTGLSLVLVVAAIVALAWVFGRLQGGRARNAGVIDVLAAQPLGAKERLLLVDVAGKQLLLGVTQSTIRTLHVLDEPVEALGDDPARGRFAERLRGMLQGAPS